MDSRTTDRLRFGETAVSKGQVIKIGVSAAALLVALVLVVRSMNSSGFDPQANAASVVVVCQESGQEWSVRRGFLMDELYRRNGPLDLTDGLSSPHADGRRVAFPKDQGVWKRMVAEANVQLAALSDPSDDE